MRRFLIAALSVTFVITTGCAGTPPKPAAVAEYRISGTLREVMDSIVMPNAQYIWSSVESTSGDKGPEEKAPKNDNEWAELRRHAVTLQEATDLLLIPGRHVARAGEPAKESEETPENIQKLIDANPAKWVEATHGLHDAVTQVLKAIDTKNVPGVLEAGGNIDAACESCHLVYWYPDKPDKK